MYQLTGKSFIDLKEIGEIANRNTNTIGAPLAQDFPVFNTEEEAISSMAFIDLINNLRLGISYFDMIIKRYESLIEAYQVFQLKKHEYQKNQKSRRSNRKFRKRKETRTASVHRQYETLLGSGKRHDCSQLQGPIS